MTPLRRFLTHSVGWLVMPIAVVGIGWRVMVSPIKGLALWEVVSLIHTVVAAFGVMRVAVHYVEERTLQNAKTFLCLVAGVIVAAKCGLLYCEKSGIPVLEEVSEKIGPHWLMLPVVLFFIGNVFFYLASKRSAERIGVVDEGQELRFQNLILQVDLPVVVSYAVVVLYGYGVMENPPYGRAAYFRGMSCALLTVSNLLTTAYEYALPPPPKNAPLRRSSSHAMSHVKHKILVWCHLPVDRCK